MKKAAFFNPYLDTLGGGERYFLTLASFLSKKDWQIDVFGFNSLLGKKAGDRLGIDLERVNFVNINLSQLNLFKRVSLLSKYDLSFYISDGSVPWLFAKKNILHCQVPFHNVGGRNFWNQLKIKKIDRIVCNSDFTKKFIDQEYFVKSLVVYPPVSIGKFKPGKKENLILSVGRFTDLLHNKRQDILVGGFKQILRGWKLILAGNDKEGKEFVKKLRKVSRGCPIEIKTNISLTELRKLYGRAKIFWTATGFGVDEQENPEKVEHFGITTVEAMASGCVPVAINKGGQREIVEPGKDGFLWQTEGELIELTKGLIENQKQLETLSVMAIEKSRKFSQKIFCENYEKIIEDNR